MTATLGRPQGDRHTKAAGIQGPTLHMKLGQIHRTLLPLKNAPLPTCHLTALHQEIRRPREGNTTSGYPGTQHACVERILYGEKRVDNFYKTPHFLITKSLLDAAKFNNKTSKALYPSPVYVNFETAPELANDHFSFKKLWN